MTFKNGTLSSDDWDEKLDLMKRFSQKKQSIDDCWMEIYFVIFFPLCVMNTSPLWTWARLRDRSSSSTVFVHMKAGIYKLCSTLTSSLDIDFGRVSLSFSNPRRTWSSFSEWSIAARSSWDFFQFHLPFFFRLITTFKTRPKIERWSRPLTKDAHRSVRNRYLAMFHLVSRTFRRRAGWSWVSKLSEWREGDGAKKKKT